MVLYIFRERSLPEFGNAARIQSIYPQESGKLPFSNQLLIEPLTAREMDVLELLVEGLSNQEIATRLMIAEGTVKYYTRQIYGKLQVRNRAQAINLARELRLV